MPRSALGLRLLLAEATRFFFFVFLIFAPRTSGDRERDFGGGLEIDRASRGRGGGVRDLEIDLATTRGRATTGDLDRGLLMDLIRGPLEGDLEAFLRNGSGERFRPRNRGDSDRLLLNRRGGSGLNEIDNSRRRSGVRLRVRLRLRLRVLVRGLGVTSRPNGSFITLGRFSITVRTS